MLNESKKWEEYLTGIPSTINRSWEFYIHSEIWVEAYLSGPER